jgi:uncharacterized membrane protein
MRLKGINKKGNFFSGILIIIIISIIIYFSFQSLIKTINYNSYKDIILFEDNQKVVLNNLIKYNEFTEWDKQKDNEKDQFLDSIGEEILGVWFIKGTPYNIFAVEVFKVTITRHNSKSSALKSFNNLILDLKKKNINYKINDIKTSFDCVFFERLQKEENVYTPYYYCHKDTLIISYYYGSYNPSISKFKGMVMKQTDYILNQNIKTSNITSKNIFSKNVMWRGIIILILFIILLILIFSSDKCKKCKKKVKFYNSEIIKNRTFCDECIEMLKEKGKYICKKCGNEVYDGDKEKEVTEYICNHCEKRSKSKDKNEDHSLELLRERLAKGEITKKDFKETKRILEK